MPRITYTSADGEVRTVEAAAGDSVMETAVRHGVTGIVGECGGSLSCATCHVFAAPADLPDMPPMAEMEDEMLYGTAVERRENSRLGCQLVLGADSDWHVETPKTQE